MALYIITDSSSDLPKDIISKFNLDVVPLSVTNKDITYTDNVTIDSKQLMDRMRSGDVFITSQPTTIDYYNNFLKYAENNDSVIYIAFSSGLSGSYNCANIAKNDILEKYPNFDITIIDTKCASMGFGMVVYKALIMQANGIAKEEIIKATEFNAENMQHIFTVDDLEYLLRGGRVSKASAFVGGLLGIKPIMHVSDDGKLIPIEKVRGRQKSIARMAEIVGERGVCLEKQTIGISHGDDMEAATKLKTLLTQLYGCTDFIINNIGCAVGAHSGPGTLAVFFLDEALPYENN